MRLILNFFKHDYLDLFWLVMGEHQKTWVAPS